MRGDFEARWRGTFRWVHFWRETILCETRVSHGFHFEGSSPHTYSTLWLWWRLNVYDTNITNPNPNSKPTRLIQPLTSNTSPVCLVHSRVYQPWCRMRGNYCGLLSPIMYRWRVFSSNNWQLRSYPTIVPMYRSIPYVYTFTRRTDQIDHDLDHLDPNLPSWDALHYLYSTGPTRKHVLDYAGYSTPTRQQKLDHTDHTDREYILPERCRSWSGNWACVRGVYTLQSYFNIYLQQFTVLCIGRYVA